MPFTITHSLTIANKSKRGLADNLLCQLRIHNDNVGLIQLIDLLCRSLV